ncbi:MAG: SDR family NAD(P)-dependent oxidoreductase [Anaerovoracaceae bacterium]|nr:SDR family NAD(P)-dependent oxidoreductase [Anaerovoracaceae bacterium]
MTGCSSGLGRGIADAVLSRGGCAVVTARDSERVRHFESEYPGRALALPLDLADADTAKAALQSAYEKFGHIDVLVNNAGHGYRAAIEESEPDKVRQLFEEVFFAPMDIARMVLPRMREQGGGLIINVTSIGAVRGALGNGYYSAAKGALELASEAMQKEAEPFGIRVMLVEPGAMRTGFFDGRMQGTETKISAYDGIAASYRKELINNRHDQNSDPAKCGEVIVSAALSDDPPFRLLLDSDAVGQAETVLENRLAELRRWKEKSVSTDFERS